MKTLRKGTEWPLVSPDGARWYSRRRGDTSRGDFRTRRFGSTSLRRSDRAALPNTKLSGSGSGASPRLSKLTSEAPFTVSRRRSPAVPDQFRLHPRPSPRSPIPRGDHGVCKDVGSGLQPRTIAVTAHRTDRAPASGRFSTSSASASRRRPHSLRYAGTRRPARPPGRRGTARPERVERSGRPSGYRIDPSARGMGSPVGRDGGWARWMSILSSSRSEAACSRRSASSPTSSQEMPSVRDRNDSSPAVYPSILAISLLCEMHFRHQNEINDLRDRVRRRWRVCRRRWISTPRSC